MDINTLQTAYENMLNALKEFQIFNLDYPDISKKVFQKEEEYFENYQNYKALSLVSYIFYDLGIIE